MDSEAEAATGSPKSGGQFADSEKDRETGTDGGAFVMELIRLRCATSGCEVGLEACALDCSEGGFAAQCGVKVESLISAMLSRISYPC